MENISQPAVGSRQLPAGSPPVRQSASPWPVAAGAIAAKRQARRREWQLPAICPLPGPVSEPTRPDCFVLSRLVSSRLVSSRLVSHRHRGPPPAKQ
ncbi:uncharacterized protein UV8b_08016 [Ustilaginoidea virens]|uniref:Uncharacterized protein n=1 Tax=Ustilaginoidea virens TaxID=1159556 RepID=A0A8E5HYL6_USTVR|nr:uncharacterized protein UV8b_08016 [Ustilaginoidea virens]QUC23775.1 hypothetical protein UV8b_08016 [Ustilaginoidea virens]